MIDPPTLACVNDTPARPAKLGDEPSHLLLQGPVMSIERASPLFLGLDLSTQQLKAIIIAEDASVVHESAVNFTKDLPQYGTANGVTIGPGPGEVTSPVAMWVHALDLLMERVRASGFDASRVVAISGAGQVCLQTNGLIQDR